MMSNKKLHTTPSRIRIFCQGLETHSTDTNAKTATICIAYTNMYIIGSNANVSINIILIYFIVIIFIKLYFIPTFVRKVIIL